MLKQATARATKASSSAARWSSASGSPRSTASATAHDHAHARVDHVLLGSASPAHRHHQLPQAERVDRGQPPGARRPDFDRHRSARQAVRALDAPHIAALRLDHGQELLPRRSRLQGAARAPHRLGSGLGARKGQHQGRKLEGQRPHVVRPPAVQDLHGLANLERVPDRPAQRLAHVRDERGGVPALGARGPDQASREPARGVAFLHESAVPALDVVDDRGRPLGDLLAHDARDDERLLLHGRRDVAQGVEQAVGGSQVGALSDHRHAE